MSLLPFFDESLYLIRPSRLLDQHFGLTLDPEDFLQPLTTPRMMARCPAGYLRPWRSTSSEQDIGSTVKFDKDKFQANLDVQQFKPEEISVKQTGDNTIVVEGKHEEKQDEHGFISRHFVRKYVLPKNCDIKKIETKLSSDGVLSIVAPKIDASLMEHKNIPIQQTGEPAKKIENRVENKMEKEDIKQNEK